MRQLEPNLHLVFPPNFGTIIELARPAEFEMPPIYLGSEIYTDISKIHYGKSKEWPGRKCERTLHIKYHIYS